MLNVEQTVISQYANSPTIIQLIENGQIEGAFESLLSYYDKTYHHQIAKRSKLHKIEDEGFTSPHEWANKLLQYCKTNLSFHNSGS